MKTMTLTALATVTLLSACGGSGSNPFDDVSEDFTAERGDVTANADGSYTIVDGGETIELAATGLTINGQDVWLNETNRAGSFTNDDVTLLGGFSSGVHFSAIDGTTSNAPTGNATFVGSYTYFTPTLSEVGSELTLEFDLADMEIETPDGSVFEVDGEVTADGTIFGTVEYNDDDVEIPFSGGFYGENTVGGAFDSETASGVFYGTK